MRRASWTDVSRATVDWAGMGDLMLFAMRMYMVGPQTIFALDMTMRAETGGERGIHDLLHHLVDDYVEQDRGFGEDELDDVLEAVSGPEAVAFYERYIDGPEIPDPSEFLGVIGYALVDGEVVPLDGATPAQLRAREDYFSETGRP
jgi:predicted metalloprotease with PDZ domain